MLEDIDTEEFKKTVKRLQDDYQLELELENEMAEIAKSEENSEKEEDEQRNWDEWLVVKSRSESSTLIVGSVLSFSQMGA